MRTYTHAELVAIMRNQITTNPEKTVAALLRIYKNQWGNEQASKSVIYKNGIGFRPQDVKICSSMAEQALKKGSLSEKQIKWVAKLIAKYAGQLVDGSIAEGKIVKLQKGKFIVNK